MGERRSGHDWRWASPDPFAEPNVCARCGASANGLNNFGACPGPATRPTVLTCHGETGKVECDDFSMRYPWSDAWANWCPAPTPEAPSILKSS